MTSLQQWPKYRSKNQRMPSLKSLDPNYSALLNLSCAISKGLVIGGPLQLTLTHDISARNCKTKHLFRDGARLGTITFETWFNNRPKKS